MPLIFRKVMIGSRLDVQAQEAFISGYDGLMKGLDARDVVVFCDGVHPTFGKIENAYPRARHVHLFVDNCCLPSCQDCQGLAGGAKATDKVAFYSCLMPGISTR